jgi:hypothetical protein
VKFCSGNRFSECTFPQHGFPSKARPQRENLRFVRPAFNTPDPSVRTLYFVGKLDVLIENITKSGTAAFETVELPIIVLSLLSVARVLKEPGETVSDAYPTPDRVNLLSLLTHERHVDPCVGPYQTAAVTASVRKPFLHGRQVFSLLDAIANYPLAYDGQRAKPVSWNARLVSQGRSCHGP